MVWRLILGNTIFSHGSGKPPEGSNREKPPMTTSSAARPHGRQRPNTSAARRVLIHKLQRLLGRLNFSELGQYCTDNIFLDAIAVHGFDDDVEIANGDFLIF